MWKYNSDKVIKTVNIEENVIKLIMLDKSLIDIPINTINKVEKTSLIFRNKLIIKTNKKEYLFLYIHNNVIKYINQSRNFSSKNFEK